ncbi:hypothetical protein COC42_00615 [Sphingomonas spermidinifaciens]|uniref:DUF2336 domain-containing protein n=1 Tax=Sphingomonas spermidinifaciens TaxID=1141889 RepID=A0A2A4B5Q7_9SPHN|nr:hypothetical protein [Sphingomonas spermidinifaciens]PCD02976.1 hypothetical protein COC42_00615 [Sphingomonas spermidinifaciens]
MSLDPTDPHGGPPVDAATLLAEADGAEALARRLREGAVRDLLIPDAARLDDRRRAALRTLLRAIVGTIGADIHEFALRRLRREDEGAATALAGVAAPRILSQIEHRLARKGEVAADLIGRVTLDLIGAALPSGVVESVPPFAPAGHAAERAASALRLAESRRRTPPDQPPYAIDLPAESQAQFTWWIAAAIAEEAAAPADSAAAIDRALADGAVQALSQADEGERLEAAAMRLAGLADRRGPALAEAMDHCLAERRIVLLAALIAHAAGAPYEAVRGLIVEPADPRLWLLLRSLDLPRESIARVGYSLSEADRRRDLERFADQLDIMMALPAVAVTKAIAALRLPQGYRDVRLDGPAGS